MARAADNTKALDISVLHVEPIVSYTSYLVLCTGERYCIDQKLQVLPAFTVQLRRKALVQKKGTYVAHLTPDLQTPLTAYAPTHRTNTRCHAAPSCRHASAPHAVMSKPQLLAVLGRMEEAAADFGLTKSNSVGSSQWEVLDFGSVVCHVFTPEQREHYNLDDFYALAEEVELPFVSDTVAPAAPGGFEQQFAGGGSVADARWSKSL